MCVCVVEWLPLSRAESGRPSSSSGPTAAAGTVLAEPGEGGEGEGGGGEGGLSYMYMYMCDESLTLLRVNNFTLCMCDSCAVCVCVAHGVCRHGDLDVGEGDVNGRLARVLDKVSSQLRRAWVGEKLCSILAQYINSYTTYTVYRSSVKL